MQLDSSARRAIIAVPGGGPEALLDLSVLRCLGAHNAHNAGTAALLALSLGLGLTEEGVQRALPTLQAPPHRMEIGELGLHGYKDWIHREDLPVIGALFRLGLTEDKVQKALPTMQYPPVTVRTRERTGFPCWQSQT